MHDMYIESIWFITLQNPHDRAISLLYRDAEVPFVVYNIHDLVRVLLSFPSTVYDLYLISHSVSHPTNGVTPTCCTL